jgi:hypothetical protein
MQNQDTEPSQVRCRVQLIKKVTQSLTWLVQFVLFKGCVVICCKPEDLVDVSLGMRYIDQIVCSIIIFVQ